MVTVTVELSDGLANLGNLGKETIREGMNKTAQDLIRNLQINSPVDHGLLKQWAVTGQSDMEVIIQSPAMYASYVNYGHPQEPGRFIPGEWKGDRFEYKPGNKTGMVLKADFVEGKHFVEDSIEATQARIQEFFTINGG
jgi:hypothetical protein